jgi:muramoyltetrapeptide carboxypeptidase LdcA involved in peptidoglycan recycling
MDYVFPAKLKAGDEVRIIAPAKSMGLINDETKEYANKRFKDLGLALSFGENIDEFDEFNSSSINSRVKDFEDAFLDKNVKAVITVIGGFNSNQLLNHIDWSIIKNNPKIFCGFSDITVLNNAILKMSGLVNYSGPHYSSLGMKLFLDYTLNYFKKCLMEEEPFEVLPSKNWSDDLWFMDQDNRSVIDGDGWTLLNRGKAKGTIIGGNLGSLSLLKGTEYMPDISGSILFLEDTETCDNFEFDRLLVSLIQQPNFSKVKGIVFGRFQKNGKMNLELLKKIIGTKPELSKIPIIANLDFGHTTPIFTFPIGGEAELKAGRSSKLLITKH